MFICLCLSASDNFIVIQSLTVTTKKLLNDLGSGKVPWESYFLSEKLPEVKHVYIFELQNQSVLSLYLFGEQEMYFVRSSL